MENELDEISTVKDFLTVPKEGSREINRNIILLYEVIKSSERATCKSTG
jgi:hypothetical protein